MIRCKFVIGCKFVTMADADASRVNVYRMCAAAEQSAVKMALESVRRDDGPLLLVLGAGEAAQHVLQRRERQVQAVHVVLAERRQPHLTQQIRGLNDDTDHCYLGSTLNYRKAHAGKRWRSWPTWRTSPSRPF